MYASARVIEPDLLGILIRGASVALPAGLAGIQGTTLCRWWGCGERRGPGACGYGRHTGLQMSAIKTCLNHREDYLPNCNPLIPVFNLSSGTLSVVDTVHRRILGRTGHHMKPVTPGKAVSSDLAG